MASTIEIFVDGVDETNGVLYSSAVFESQQNSVPGTFEITIKDPERVRGPYVTGSEVELLVDSVRLFGGYVTQISSKFALPADELPTDTRLWVLRGVDYNILFDKRVTRYPTNYLTFLPYFTADAYDGELVTLFATNYIDVPAGFDLSTEVDNVAYPFNLPAPDANIVGSFLQQGTPWRDQMERLAAWSNAVWYISPDKKLHFHALENAVAPFEFSDNPSAVQVGPRDVSATEDAAQLANDVMVWGGSEWTEGAIFARAQNATSITNHNRWQVAEHHFGEDGYKLDTQWRADLIAEGHDVPVGNGFNPGSAYPQWAINLTWFAENVPGADHIRAGEMVTTHLSTFGGSLDPITLPMRSIRISFVGIDGLGNGHVQFSGSMGLQLNDPFSIWAYLRHQLARQRASVVAAVTNTSPSSTYGAFGQFEPAQITSTLYRLPNNIGYVAGTSVVYVDGVLMIRDTDYTESDPVAGEITFTSTPSGWVWLVVRTT